MVLPNFLMAGCMRCGSTWIHSCLKEHPDVLVPTIRKEIHYFDYDPYYEQGLDWYASLFDHFKGEKAIGEVTPGYFATPKAAHRIHELVPDVKLILSLRDPSERAFSSYIGCVQIGVIPKESDFFTVCQALEQERKPKILEQGLYYKHLMHYLSLFSQEQILILFYDELKRDPESYIRKIFDFIGVDSSFKPSVLDTRVNEGKYNEMIRLGYRGARKYLQDSQQATTIGRLWKVLKRYGKRRPELPQDLRARLVDFYKEDITNLENFLNVDLSSWKQ